MSVKRAKRVVKKTGRAKGAKPVKRSGGSPPRRSVSARRRAAPRKKAAAGRRGDDVRSDAFVQIEPRRSGGVDVRVDSKVDAFFHTSIVETIEGVLHAYAVPHAVVVVEDAGALPWVLAARVEAALRRGGRVGDGRPPRACQRDGETARDRLRRSRLYLPGNEPKFMLNAGIHHPDGVILDLEDSVHPDEKDAARLVVRNALRCHDFLGAERMVRINQLPLGLEDLDDIVPESPDLILIPKVETAEQVLEVDARIRAKREAGPARKKAGRPAKRAPRAGRVKSAGADDGSPIWLMPILESALGVENAYAIASASDRVVALTIGLEDYTADMGVRKTREGRESHFARSRLVNAARAAGVQAIDSVYGDVGDLDGLSAWGMRARQMGFEGMGCIHPRQIRPIHEAFAPAPEEIERAQRVVAAFENAQRKGLGVVSLGTRMIDPPVVRRAQRLVDRARREGLID